MNERQIDIFYYRLRFYFIFIRISQIKPFWTRYSNTKLHSRDSNTSHDVNEINVFKFTSAAVYINRPFKVKRVNVMSEWNFNCILIILIHNKLAKLGNVDFVYIDKPGSFHFKHKSYEIHHLIIKTHSIKIYLVFIAVWCCSKLCYMDHIIWWFPTS